MAFVRTSSVSLAGRLRRNFPEASAHLAALAGGSLVLAIWLFGDESLPKPLALAGILIAFAFTMVAPWLGALAILKSRPPRDAEHRASILRPYRTWALIGIATGALAFTTVLFGADRIHLSILNWAFVVIIVMSWLVPVFVPLARFARWQVKPPTLTSHTR